MFVIASALVFRVQGQLQFCSSTNLPAGTVGQSYSTTICANGGTGGSYTYSDSGNFPPWANQYDLPTIQGTPTAAGTYHFKITVTIYSPYQSITNNFNLTVNPQPPPSVQTVAASSVGINTATLNLSVNPNGASTVIYFQYGTTTSYGGTTSSENIGTTSGNYSMPLSGLSGNTVYHFRAVASNSGGTNYGSDLTFTTSPQPPPSVSTLAAGSIGNNSAVLNLSVNPNGGNTSVYFKYGTSTSYGSQSFSLVNITASGQYGITVSGLSANTLYHYRAVAYNSGGTNLGNDMTFTTSGSSPQSPPVVQTMAASLLTTNSATLNSTVNPNGADTSVFFQWGTTEVYTTSTPVADIGSGTVAVLWSAELTQLAESTGYHYRIVAYNSAGTNYGSDISFSTLGVPPTIGTQPQGQSLAVGGNATLSVSATGVGTLSYHWQRNGVPIANAGDYSGANSATLTVLGAQTSDSGMYNVVVTDSNGSITSSKARLSVLPLSSIYVTSGNSVLLYGANGQGGFQLNGTISGGNTGINSPSGLAVDTQSHLYVSSYYENTVSVFPTTSLGNVSPSTILTGSSTKLSSPIGIAIDGNGVLYAANNNNGTVTEYQTSELNVFTGDVNLAPSREITSSHTTADPKDFDVPRGIAVDGNSDMYISSYIENWVNAYCAGASGTPTPLSTLPSWFSDIIVISLDPEDLPDDTAGWGGAIAGIVDVAVTAIGGSTDLEGQPTGIAVGPNGFVYVANQLQNSVSVFTIGSDGAPNLIAVIEGAQTGLNEPAGVAVDQNGCLYVANAQGGTVTAYDTTVLDQANLVDNANSIVFNLNPIATISGLNGSVPNEAIIALTLASPQTVIAGASPFINVSPNNQTTLANTNASFYVMATGYTPMSIQWYRNGTPLSAGGGIQISNGPDINGVNTSMLTISNVDASDDANYYAVVSNAYGTATSIEAVLAVTNSTAPSKVISLSGNLSFGDISIGNSAQSSLTISNAGNTTLTVSNISYPPGFTGSWSGGAITPGGSQVVTVTFSPVSDQSYGGAISVYSDATGGANTINVSGTGTISQEPIIGVNGNLSFGNVLIGGSVQRNMVITNQGNLALTVSGFSYPSGFNGNWSGGTIPPGGSQIVVVTFAPTLAQGYGGSIVVNSDAQNAGNTINASGTGMAIPTTVMVQTNYQVQFSWTPASVGFDPQSQLVEGNDGALYGTTYEGGTNNIGGGGDGTIFKINKDGTGYTVLHNFGPSGSGDGIWPEAGLVLGSGGVLYGTTYAGGFAHPNGGVYGVNNGGTIFKINQDGSGYAVIHSFGASGDGYTPDDALFQANDGRLYGTAQNGGPNNAQGIVFGINTDGNGYQIIHAFVGGGNSDGVYPVASLTEGTDGALYGTTPSGQGTTGYGSVGIIFKLNKDGSDYQILHNFGPLGGTDGQTPEAGLIDTNGVLYGTTEYGGLNGAGTVFKLNEGGSDYSVIHNFNFSGDGGHPYANLMIASSGALWGTTENGGTNSSGIVFALNQDGSDYTIMHEFGPYNTTGDGFLPQAGLMEGSDGAIYGTTQDGGTYGYGTIFCLPLIPLAVSPVLSTVTASPSEVQADGMSDITVTVTLMDATGHPVRGKNVVVGAVGQSGRTFFNPSITQPGSPTDDNGQTTAIITSMTQGVAYVYASDVSDSVSIQNQQVMVQFSQYTPRLAAIASSANLTLTWPTNAVGFIVESTTSLAPPVIWSTNSTVPTVIGGQNVVTVPVTGTQQFYRLIH